MWWGARVVTDPNRDDTAGTADDEAVDELRRHGIVGPFAVADWAVLSDTGLRRPRNEDRWIADPAVGVVVADGMGGHAAGDVAAEAAARATFADLPGLREPGARDLVRRANAAVARAGAERGVERLGSTFVALAVHHNHVVIVHVGDSRAYRLRDGELEQLTRDHSVRAELEAAGVPLEAATQAHVRLDAVTSYLGHVTEPVPPFRVATFSVMAGDRFLLCSDGVHGSVGPDVILRALGTATCRGACHALIEAANAAGGSDNATAAVIEFRAAVLEESS